MKVLVHGPETSIIQLSSAELECLIGGRIDEGYYAKFKPNQICTIEFDLTKLLHSITQLKIFCEVRHKIDQSLNELLEKTGKFIWPMEVVVEDKAVLVEKKEKKR